MKDWFVGQDIWDVFAGHGKVISINDLNYAVMVQLDADGRSYACNREGVCYFETFQRVYQKPVRVVEDGFLTSKIKTGSDGRQMLSISDSVNFALITADNHLILASQSRPTVCDGRVANLNTLGLFGGFVDPKDENTDMALFRELKEETNLDTEDIEASHLIYDSRAVSLAYTTEYSTVAILFTKGTRKEIESKLRCNDKKENISITIFEPEWLKDALLEDLMCSAKGLKLYLLLKTVQEHKIDNLRKY